MTDDLNRKQVLEGMDLNARETCACCGIEKIGGKCLTRDCNERDSSVDQVFGEGDGDE